MATLWERRRLRWVSTTFSQPQLVKCQLFRHVDGESCDMIGPKSCSQHGRLFISVHTENWPILHTRNEQPYLVQHLKLLHAPLFMYVPRPLPPSPDIVLHLDLVTLTFHHHPRSQNALIVPRSNHILSSHS